jgi:glycosyltransferase involved in cell wall biosynthesis
MRIGINLRTLVPGKIGGLETYVRAILEQYRRSDVDHEFVIYGSSYNVSTLQFNDRRFRIVELSDTDPLSDLSRALSSTPPTVWFCPLLTLEPLVLPIPAVVQIPDLQHEYFPDFFPPNVLRWRRQQFAFSARRAEATLTLSHHSKQCIVDVLRVAPEKVHPIHLAVDDEYFDSRDPATAEHVRATYHLPDRFIYYPANTWPHKNHLTLLRALQILKERDGQAVPLVLSGSKGEGHGQLVRAIREMNLTDSIHFLGYVEKKHLPYIYRAATALVFPSLFEGFGIPPLEAMASGCPVIASHAASLPEVVGRAAVLCDPHSPVSFAAAIDRVVNNPTLRERLIERGLSQVRRYSWERTAAQTLEVLESAAALRPAQHNGPLVTVITPSYNQGPFIRETIESVLAQDYQNLEYIVCDGGSTDQTVEVLNSYGDRIRWVSEADGGQADAVNKGLAMARGELIGWLNSDDTYYPGAVRRAVEFFRWHPDTVLVYGEAHYTDQAGNVTGRYPTEGWDRNRLGETCFICQPTAFMRKAAVQAIGGLDDRLHFCMDYDLWIRLGSVGPVGYIEEFMGTSRLYPENKTLGQRRKVFQEILSTVKKYYGYVPLTWVQGQTDYLLGGTLERPAKQWTLRFLLLGLFIMLRYNWNRPRYLARMIRVALSALWRLYRSPASGHTGQWPDRWVSRRAQLEVSVPDGATALVVQGRHLSPEPAPLKIRVRMNGKRIGRFSVTKQQPFVTTIAFSRAIPAGTATLEFIADRAFVPARFGASTDTRELAWVLDSVHFTMGDDS